jgi:hypothetical protein
MSGSSAEDPDEPGQARDAEEASALSGVAPGTARAEGPLSLEGADLTPAQRRELLLAAARRLMGTDDPTALSYVLTALLQVDLASRQALLEAPDTAARLLGLERHLVHERWFLRQGLRPIIIDPGQPGRQVS